MAFENSLTVVVPALNEETHLARAVGEMIETVGKYFDEYEILIFNDGSIDRTGQIAEELAAKYEHVTAYHHVKPRCMGGVIRHGLQEAKMNYFIYIDGKGATSAKALESIFAEKGKADLIISYATNMHQRKLSRRIVSWTFRTTLNILFGLKIKHFGNSILYRTEQLRQFDIRTDSFGYQPEALIKMIRCGCTYMEVPFEDRFDLAGRKTKAFRSNNLINVSKFILLTMWDIYVKKKQVT